MPEASRRVAGGTRESTVRERQTTAAAAEHPPPRASASLAPSSMNRRMPNGTYGGVGGGSRKAPTYPICEVKTPAGKLEGVAADDSKPAKAASSPITLRKGGICGNTI